MSDEQMAVLALIGILALMVIAMFRLRSQVKQLQKLINSRRVVLSRTEEVALGNLAAQVKDIQKQLPTWGGLFNIPRPVAAQSEVDLLREKIKAIPLLLKHLGVQVIHVGEKPAQLKLKKKK